MELKFILNPYVSLTKGTTQTLWAGAVLFLIIRHTSRALATTASLPPRLFGLLASSRMCISSLQESRALRSVKCFAECQKSDTRQRASLLSAALGKARLSAKSSLPNAKHSAQHGTRHRWSLPSVALH